jgi:hypothetical protein
LKKVKQVIDMKLKFLFVTFVLLISTIGYSQVGGRATYQFLNIVSSPIQDALGGKIITSRGDDVNQGLLNPSLISPKINNRLGVNYGSYLADVSFGTATYGYSWGEKNKTIQAGVTYINYGNFEGADQFAQKTGDFTGSEVALSTGYAYELPIKGLTVGANAKLISSTLDIYSSFGGAIDLATCYYKEESTFLFTLVLQNIGTQFTTYSGNREPLPFEIVAGISKKLNHAPIRWHVTLQNLQKWQSSYSNVATTSEVQYKQANFFENALHHINIGTEVFPDRIITIRLGYNFRRSYELSIPNQRNFAGLSTGFGVRVNRFRFDFSYSRYTSAGNSALFGAQFSF